MERVEKLATPATALTEVVPESVPAPGFVPIANVIVAVEVVTVFAKASCTVTCTAGAMATPATAFEGCTVIASFEAAAKVMLKALEVAFVSVADEATKV